MKHEIGSISSTNNDWGQSETEAFSRLNTQRYLAGSGKAQCKGISHCVSVCSTGEPFSHKRPVEGPASWTQHEDLLHSTATAAEKEQNPSCYCAGSDDLQLWGSFLILFWNSLAQAQFTFLAWVTSVLPLAKATGPFLDQPDQPLSGLFQQLDSMRDTLLLKVHGMECGASLYGIGSRIPLLSLRIDPTQGDITLSQHFLTLSQRKYPH